jgi:hypothetical protein
MLAYGGAPGTESYSYVQSNFGVPTNAVLTLILTSITVETPILKVSVFRIPTLPTDGVC